MSNDLFASKIIPVIVINDVQDAVSTAEALQAGGQSVLEITLRTPAGLESIRQLSSNSELIVGAGTVTDVDSAETAIAAGAKFLVSPGISLDIVQFAKSAGIPIIPGCVTPSEIMGALDLGLEILKFFPANVYGGISALKALAGPFPNVQFVPTGGVNADNLSQYLNLPNVKAIGGSWMATSKLIQDHQFETITQLTREAIAIVKNSELVNSNE
ncbi:MAG: bifunctional 4-hydroxy-2-oxoglutarate aldolase/2-dehydro-3-deoxy-phosphogluconate aldolase [Bifidobacteriaceae bacterium]|jgi:2-dehydro-3-deoxyphosphogluconate aldolase/(4S)-4-hydroxy-2-oxoglutarate aldolase|nr:bifunctional 4-hydroxy-2-oxoglutarate aldolase/2-dehydro-3-deoxy-phosphogluconate aldolase [Bifidobacteriaceae bacterium]